MNDDVQKLVVHQSHSFHIQNYESVIDYTWQLDMFQNQMWRFELSLYHVIVTKDN